jgi:uncharacterized protein YegL
MVMGKGRTEIIFLLDRSGSMAGLENDTIGGFNGFIKRQVEQDEETRLTTVLFDDQYEILWNGVLAREVELTTSQYYVRGCTALLDAIGKTIVDVNHRLKVESGKFRPDKVIFVITTDGLENASSEFTIRKINKMIQYQQEKSNWDFIFLGANIDAVKEARTLGISREHAYQFDSSKEGVEHMYNLVCEAILEKRIN